MPHDVALWRDRLRSQRKSAATVAFKLLVIRSFFEYLRAAGLELVDALRSEPSLKTYHLLPSVRGDLLAKLGRFEEARPEFERAASLAHNARERDLLPERGRVRPRLGIDRDR